MKITFQQNPEDHVYPVMHDKTSIAKEFNKRQQKLWAAGNIKKVDFEQVATVLLEILIDDYNKRHGSRKRKVNK